MLVNNTPVETHLIEGVSVLVKREDLCAPFPGPSFSKIRGVYAHILNRPEKVIGALDTSHSKAGWAVAYVCRHLGKQAIDFWPRYKDQVKLKDQQNQAQVLGANLVELQAGRSAILYHRAKKLMPEGSYLMPNALKLRESVTENAEEAARTDMPDSGTLVISISSGTVAAGVISGILRARRYYHFVLHMGYSRSQSACAEYVRAMAGAPQLPLTLVDEGYGYADAARGVTAPFPCNEFYDLKAWKWLTANIHDLPQPVVFWNIGD